jgi:hypothetical protein
MNAARLSLTGFLTGLLVAFSCTAADTSGDGTGVSEDDAAEEAAKVICEAYFDCDCGDGSMYSSPENCELELAADLQAMIDEAKDDDDLTYDGSCIPKYEAAIEAMECLTLQELFFYSNITEALAGLSECNMYYGDKGDGDSCNFTGDTDIHDCEQGLGCDEMSGECVAPKEEGDSCNDGDECGGGTICVSIQGNQDTTCEILPSTGDTCLGAGDLCAADNYCDQANKSCELLPESGDCAPGPNLVGATCALGKTCDGGSCEDAPAAGENCGTDGACEEGAWCNNMSGQCEAQDAYVCILPFCVQFPGAC